MVSLFLFMEVRRVELLSKAASPCAPTCFPFVFKSRSDPAREGRLNSDPAQYILEIYPEHVNFQSPV